jgi:hypothetical protein
LGPAWVAPNAGSRRSAGTGRRASRNRRESRGRSRARPHNPTVSGSGRTRRSRPAISHIPLSHNLPLSPISRRAVAPGLLSPAGVGRLPSAGVGRLPPAVPDPGRELRSGPRGLYLRPPWAACPSPSRIPAVALAVGLLHPRRGPVLGDGRSHVRVRRREPMLGRSSALVPDPGSDPSPGRAFARGVAGNTVALA